MKRAVIKISFSEKGKGFPVVLLHGFCETREIWDELADSLSKYFRVLTPDLPGFGNSPLPESDFSIADIGEAVFQWLQNLHLKEVVVIGHSLGGYITLALAKSHPQVLSGFGLFHATAFADTEEKKSTRNKTIDFVKKRGVAAFAHSFLPQLFYHKNKKSLKGEIDQLIKMTAETKLDSLIAYTKAMRDRADRTDVLKSFDKPILLIAGDNDTAVSLEDIRVQENMPKKPIVHVLENTGHMGMIEQKSLSLTAVADFISTAL